MDENGEFIGVELIIKNYRCFSDSMPAKITLRKGNTAILGTNNSGKSSLLKFFYELRDIFKSISDNEKSCLLHLLQNLDCQFDIVTYFYDIFCSYNNRPIEITMKFTTTKIDDLKVIIKVERNVPPKFTAQFYVGDKLLNKADIKGGERITLPGVIELGLSDISRLFRPLSDTIYIGSFRNAINIGATNRYYDISVGQDFIKSWRYWKTGENKADNKIIHELTNNIKNIFELDSLEINASPDDTTLQTFVNGESYKLSELGSGISQFIIVLANVAIKKPSFIMIDEPELNLHATLQLDFLTTLASFATEGVLFATHINGLAQSGATWTYTANHTNVGCQIKIYEEDPRLVELLGELNFSSYRELGFDKILLVEGKEDIKTFQQLLRLFGMHHKIVILPLHGRDLINGNSEQELLEVKRISDNIYAIIDSEIYMKEGKITDIPQGRKDFAKICNKIGITCHVLEFRAIENYLSDTAIKKVKGEKYKMLEPYQVLDDVKPCWAKWENWKIAREMTIEDIEKNDLGEFLMTLKEITKNCT